MPFHQLAVELDARDLGRAEDACAGLGALSVALADAGDAPLLEPAPGETPLWPTVRLRALFPHEADPRIAAATLEAVLGLAPGSVGFELVEDRAWEREWLKDFRPMRFGRRLWVAPVGQRPDGAGVCLELDPGLAFGTGTHATTALCLEWLDGRIAGGERVLDYGCGSGILALGALALGAGSAVAWDIDPQALVATRGNAAATGFAARLGIAEREDEVAGSFDVVLSNILAGPLVALAPRLAGLTRGGGDIALAGMLDGQAGEVARAYHPWFDIGPAAAREGWTLLTGRRRAE